MSKHAKFSTFREKIVEYDFLSQIMKRFWNDDDFRLQISRVDVDNGIDIIAMVGAKSYIIQLKSKKYDEQSNSKSVVVDIDYALSKRREFMLILVLVDDKLTLGSYKYRLVRGKDIKSDKLPVSKHKKANSKGKKNKRPNKRQISINNSYNVNIDDIWKILKK